MKIVFVSDQFYPRTSADSEQIISSLSALGEIADTTLLSATYRNSQADTQQIEDYYQKKCTFQLSFISHFFRNVRAFEKISFAIQSGFWLKKNAFDISYTRNIPVVITLILFTDIPIVFESYRPWPSRNFISKWFFKWLTRRAQFLGIILHSKFAAQSFLNVGFDSKQLLIAHNAFSMDDYKYEDKTSIRKRYQLPTDQMIITYSGRVNKRKGVDKIFSLAKKFKGSLFLIVGSEREGEIEEKAKSFNNIRVFKWLPKKEVFSLLLASDILYIPPTTKARDKAKNTVLPLKTFMYKASGVPILGPDMKDIREVLTHDKNALLVEPDNFNSEIKGLEVLKSDKDLRVRLGNQAKKEMKELTWTKRAQKILNFIETRSGTIYHN